MLAGKGIIKGSDGDTRPCEGAKEASQGRGTNRAGQDF